MGKYGANWFIFATVCLEIDEISSSIFSVKVKRLHAKIIGRYAPIDGLPTPT
jgi:hypothetical protein